MDLLWFPWARCCHGRLAVPCSRYFYLVIPSLVVVSSWIEFLFMVDEVSIRTLERKSLVIYIVP
jgi:hypothetical protein